MRDTILLKKLKTELRGEKLINGNFNRHINLLFILRFFNDQISDEFLNNLQVILHDIKTPSIKQQV